MAQGNNTGDDHVTKRQRKLDAFETRAYELASGRCKGATPSAADIAAAKRVLIKIGRSNTPLNDKIKLVDQLKESGLSLRQFSESNKISETSLRSYIKGYRRNKNIVEQ